MSNHFSEYRETRDYSSDDQFQKGSSERCSQNEGDEMEDVSTEDLLETVLQVVQKNETFDETTDA